MVNKKHLFIILSFALLCISTIYFATSNKKQSLDQTMQNKSESAETSLFKNVYFYKAFNFKPSFILESTKLKIVNDIHFDFKTPKGMFYSKGKIFHYEADIGHMNQATEFLRLSGEVSLFGEDSDYASDKLEYNGKTGLLKAKGNVATRYTDKKTLDLINLKSQKLTSFVHQKEMFLEGSVKGDLKRYKIYEEGLRFFAESVTVKSLESLMVLSNNVKIYKNNYYLRSENAEIFLENYNKKLKYYTLYDDVKLEELLRLSSGKTQKRKAYAEKLEGVRSTGQVILTGAPRVEQGADVIKGYQITLREDTELIEVDDSQSHFSVKKDENE